MKLIHAWVWPYLITYLFHRLLTDEIGKLFPHEIIIFIIAACALRNELLYIECYHAALLNDSPLKDLFINLVSDIELLVNLYKRK